MKTKTPARPIVKWVGGKQRSIPELLTHLPAAFRNYHEPFVGGGSLFFTLQSRALSIGKSKVPFLARLNDYNPHLINLYTQVRDNVEAVLEVSRKLAKDRSEDAYYALRARFNASGYSPIEGAAAFIYINRGGFNGLWRVNRKGGCNVPYGGFRGGGQEGKAALVDEANLIAASKALQGVTLTCCDYAEAADLAIEGDLVYFDPPYIPASTTANFTSYTTAGFNDENQIDLCALAKTLVNRGVYVIISNSDTPRTRAIYTAGVEPSFRLFETQVRRVVNCDGAKRGKVGELIMVGR